MSSMYAMYQTILSDWSLAPVSCLTLCGPERLSKHEWLCLGLTPFLACCAINELQLNMRPSYTCLGPIQMFDSGNVATFLLNYPPQTVKLALQLFCHACFMSITHSFSNCSCCSGVVMFGEACHGWKMNCTYCIWHFFYLNRQMLYSLLKWFENSF